MASSWMGLRLEPGNTGTVPGTSAGSCCLDLEEGEQSEEMSVKLRPGYLPVKVHIRPSGGHFVVGKKEKMER